VIFSRAIFPPFEIGFVLFMSADVFPILFCRVFLLYLVMVMVMSMVIAPFLMMVTVLMMVTTMVMVITVM